MYLAENYIVWSCEPVLESYELGIREPRQFKIKIGYKEVFYGHSFNQETGEIDEDSNATIFARESNCFHTEKEAWKHYLKHIQEEIEDLKVIEAKCKLKIQELVGRKNCITGDNRF